MSRPRILAAALAAAVFVLAGCSGLPERGPVRTETPDVSGETQAPFDFDPPGPVPGATRPEVVEGFLTALQASPLSLRAPREFLTAQAAGTWSPGRETLVYDTADVRDVGGAVRLTLGGVVRLDSTGRWVRQEGPVGSRSLDLRLAREDGQWRIANPPDAMVVPRSHVELRYSRYFLYFLDPTRRVLVPEPVYVPWGVQAPTLLTEALLAGPLPELRGVEQTMIPGGTALDISVPVSDGVAQVPLSAHMLELGPRQRDLALAQLAWTLGQVAGVRRVLVTVDGAPLGPSSAGVAADAWTQLDPAVPRAVDTLFAVHDQDVVALGDGDVEGVLDLTGLQRRPGPAAADFSGALFAVVLDEGRTIAVLPRGARPESLESRQTYAGAGLVRPAYDLHGHLWMVDRAGGASRVLVAGPEGVAREVPAPGLAEAEVAAFALSRDGTRLAAVVQGPGGHSLRVARVVRSGEGLPLRLTPALQVRVPATAGAALADVGWRSPATLALLAVPSPRVARVEITGLDGGAVLPDEVPLADPLFAEPGQLATWPGDSAPLVVSTGAGRLMELSTSGRWAQVELPVPVRHPTFAG